MEAILLVGHGSRDPEGNEELLRFVEMVRGQAPQYVIEACFLEFAKPSIAGGIENCVRQGATRVVLVPIILFAAGHAKLHIPDAIDHAKRKYPNVEFAYGRPFGVHQKVVNILRYRLAEAGYTAGVQAGGSRDGDTAVLLLGRGSSDKDANSDFYKMARLFWEEVPVKWTESSFIGVTEPTFEEGLERCLQLGAKTVYVLPYFLFTGILIKRIEGMVAEFAQRHPDRKIVLADYFGFHPELAELLVERVNEAFAGRVAMNCDMCQYRLQAAAHMDHHHHHDDEHGHDHHHDHGHNHDHGHDHHHDHDHALSHDHGHHHAHDHHHGHEHGHNHDHGHDHHHDHDHAHSHDHGHHHAHDHHHCHDHGHSHDHGHDQHHDHDHAPRKLGRK